MSVPNPTGILQYANAVAKPARGVTVQALDASLNVLASTQTDASGGYTLTVAQPNTVTVQVLAEMKRTSGASTWDVMVRDNTQLGAEYAMRSASFAVTAAAVQRDLVAGSGWTGSGYGTPRIAGPFALLDTIYTAQQKVMATAPSTVFPMLDVFWSVNNLPAPGSVALGQIGTSFFIHPTGTVAAIYVLGKADVDTDEYDDSVVAHEWGHYYQNAFSRNDSMGGSHAGGQSLDRRIAFSEGWGNAWSGIALNRSSYTDSYGASQSQGFAIDLSVGPTSNKGWFNERSVAYVLWKLNALSGFQAVHAAMSSGVRTGGAMTSIHAFNAALKAAAPGVAALFAPILSAEGIEPNADAWGDVETNAGSSTVALPMYQSKTAGVNLPNVCVSNVFGSYNKLGNYAYVRFTTPVAATYQITVGGGSLATDPDFGIYDQGVLVGLGDDAGPSSETQNLSLSAGTHVLVVFDYNNAAASSCFTVSIN